MTWAPDGMPTDLADYVWVTPVEGWALHDGIDGRGDVQAVLGFQLGGKWRGLQLEPQVASDLTIELGRWLTDLAQSIDAQQDNHDA